jgi:hypothetical protein
VAWNDTAFTQVLSTFLGAPVVADPDRIVTSVNLTNTSLTVAAQPDCPRNITVTVTDTTPGVVAGTVTVTGKDARGATISEAFDFSSFTSAEAKNGTKIFASVVSVVTSGFTALGGSGDETIIVGVGTVIGLPTPIARTTAVKHVYLGGTRVAAPTVTAGDNTSGIDASASTYNGTKMLHVFYDAGG